MLPSTQPSVPNSQLRTIKPRLCTLFLGNWTSSSIHTPLLLLLLPFLFFSLAFVFFTKPLLFPISTPPFRTLVSFASFQTLSLSASSRLFGAHPEMISTLKSVFLLNPKLSHASMSLSKAPDSLKFHPLLKTPNSTLCAVPNALSPNVCLTLNRRTPLILAFAASRDDLQDIEVDGGKEELEMGSEESQEAWKQALDTFREQAKKFQGISQEAYEEYSKKAIVILKDTTEQLKVQADKARHDLTVAAKEIGEEGKEYITTAAEKSPEVKEIVETFTSPTDDLSHLSGVRDFYVGIPYGLILSIGGFLSFMVTGSIAALRFGMILGGLHLFLSISSLRAFRRGESSPRALNGQAAIASLLFLREAFLLGRGPLITWFTALISGAVAAFYVYRLVLEPKPLKDSNLETGPGN